MGNGVDTLVLIATSLLRPIWTLVLSIVLYLVSGMDSYAESIVSAVGGVLSLVVMLTATNVLFRLIRLTIANR